MGLVSRAKLIHVPCKVDCSQRGEGLVVRGRLGLSGRVEAELHLVLDARRRCPR